MEFGYNPAPKPRSRRLKPTTNGMSCSIDVSGECWLEDRAFA
jgi:hypothetical protein